MVHPELPRFAPEIAFPAYAYVPGRNPHPSHDPQGHALGLAVEAARQPICDWRQQVEHRYAIDLFNHGYYWEAHEVWEEIWIALQRTGPLADLFKGLIKLAAAGVKTRAGSEHGRRHHGRRAAELFAGAARVPEAERQAMQRATGLPLSDLIAWAEQTAAAEPPRPLRDAGEPVRVFTFVLRLDGGGPAYAASN